MQAQFECTDGVCGRSVYVLINPVIDQVISVVVKEDMFPNTEYIVPVNVITTTIAGTIQLSCSKAEVENMTPFFQTEFIQEKIPNYSEYHGGVYGLGSYYYMPYATSEITVEVPVTHREIMPGELAIQRGTRVEATDGSIGKVDEFVVNPANNHITHLVMREGHLWGKKDVIIPLSAVAKTGETIVFLKIDKHQVESLPTFPLHRLWA